MKEAQQVVAEKTSALEAEAYKTKRLHVSTITGILENYCNPKDASECDASLCNATKHYSVLLVIIYVKHSESVIFVSNI